MRSARLILVALLVAACGGGPSSSGNPAGQTAASAPTPAAAATAATPAAAVISFDCADMLEPVLEVLEELDGRLDVGLTFSDYSERVGDIAVAYNRLDIDEIKAAGAECLSTGALLEGAYNEYVKANNRWNDCIQDTDCKTDSIRSQLQGFWSNASDKIDEARDSFPE